MWQSSPWLQKVSDCCLRESIEHARARPVARCRPEQAMQARFATERAVRRPGDGFFAPVSAFGPSAVPVFDVQARGNDDLVHELGELGQ